MQWREVSATMTVLFEDPFWIGLYEKEWDGSYAVCKITFGAEPKDYQVLDFLLSNRQRLVFSPPVPAERKRPKPINPKRMQRSIGKSLGQTGVGTKAQQAMKLQQEQGKQARKVRTREEREAQKERQLALRQQKHKEKHKGH